MPPRNQSKQFDAKSAEEIGQRVRIVMGKETVTSFAKRLGVSRQWLYDILNGRVHREASVATLSSISDIVGYSLEWLVTGKGMPNDLWAEKTALVRRATPKPGARGRIKLESTDELVLVPNTFLRGIEGHIAELVVVGGEIVELSAMVGASDEMLVDRSDHKLIDKGLFLVQLEKRLLACRAIKTRSVWHLSATENIGPDTLVDDKSVLGRIRLIWKRL